MSAGRGARRQARAGAGGWPALRGDEPVAIVDIGSNSARVMVYSRDAAGHMRILASSRAPLRLVGELDAAGRLRGPAVARSLEALADFRAIALGAGARRIVAVGTSALRDAQNGPEVLARVRRELGFEVRLIDGEQEARYGFLGGLRGLPVESGVLFDMGGGSLQLTRFRQRLPLASCSLPLGALRLSRQFLASDPPRGRELRALAAHVRERVRTSGIGRLAPGEELVGTGGTVRNLAKIDRSRRGYPIPRVHGYALRRQSLHELAALLAGWRLRKRERLSGLSEERADSIVGGAVGLATLADVLGAPELLVSGLGVREGIAYSLASELLPPPAAVRDASVASLCARFWGYRPGAAARRVALAASLRQALLPKAPPEAVEALRHAATLLDIGRAVDYFDRHRHVADVVLETEMNGFSHRQIALTSAIVRCAGDSRTDPAAYGGLLDAVDWREVERLGLILALADDLEERCPPGARLEPRLKQSGAQFQVSLPALLAWRPRGIGRRFERVFGRALVVTFSRSARSAG